MLTKNKLKQAISTSLLLGTALASSANAEQVGFSTQNGGTTGGAGGQIVYATTGSEIHAAICNRAADDTPLIIHVEGTINHGNTEKHSGSCNTADDVIELKEISNISIIGVGNGALFDELGIHLRSASNIILQNLHVRNVKKSGSPTSNGGDAIGMESGVSNVWVDHVTLEASGGESEGYDALFDMKGDTKYVTLSYSILRNSGRGGLVGSSSSDTQNGPVTYHHIIYDNIDSRAPLMRGRLGHSYNNYFKKINSSGINSRVGAKMLVENNYFGNAKDPLGTFYTNDLGYYEVNGNYWSDQVVWSEQGDKNYPAGPNPSSTASVDVPYGYTMDEASCIPALLEATAGANKGLAVSDGSCTITDVPEPDPTPDPTPDPDPQPAPDGDEVLNITNSGTSSNFFDISGNLSSSKGTVNYNGLNLTDALKIESSTSITFTSVSDGQLTLVFNQGQGGDIKVNGTRYAVNNGILTLDLAAGSYSITKGDTMNLYYLSLAYDGSGGSDPEPSPNPSASNVRVELEAYAAQISFAPLTVVSDSNATGGQYVVWPNNGNAILSAPSESAGGVIAVEFSLSESSTLTLEAQVSFANGSDDSFYYKLDSGSWATQNNLQTSGWEQLTLETFNNVSAGTHTLYLQRREDGARLDNVTLSVVNGGITVADADSISGPEPTPEPEPTTQSEVHNMTTSGTSSNFYSISGNLSTSKGTVNYAGLTLTQALKIESTTAISFSAQSETQLTLVFNDGESGDIKVNGTRYAVSNGVLTLSLAAGNHTITKGDIMNLYYISASFTSN